MQCSRALGRSPPGGDAAGNDRKLITNGPYSVVRYPDLTGECLLVSGNVLLLASKGSWFTEGGLWDTVLGRTVACATVALVASVMLSKVWRLDEEDERLGKNFGQQWDEWVKRTPYRLIPFIY